MILIQHPYQGEIVRHVRAACLNVTYAALDGKKYRLREANRYKLNTGKTLADFFEDPTAATCSAPRRQEYSVTERAVLGVEERQHAAVRALWEEVFKSTFVPTEEFGIEALKEKLSQVITPCAEAEHIQNRPPYSAGTSHPYLRAVITHEKSDAKLDHTFPIPTDEAGVPQMVYEFVPEEGYITLFEWDEVIV